MKSPSSHVQETVPRSRTKHAERYVEFALHRSESIETAPVSTWVPAARPFEKQGLGQQLILTGDIG